MALASLLTGTRLWLSPLTLADVPAALGWQHDADFLRHLDAAPALPRTEAQLNEWISEAQGAKDRYLFGIRTLDPGMLIGFVELDDILWTHRTAWLALGIGERSRRGQGLGREALTLALDFAFRELNLHRLQLTVFSYNQPAIALYEKLGFQREGAYREFLQRDNQRFDMLLYGLLSREWFDQHP